MKTNWKKLSLGGKLFNVCLFTSLIWLFIVNEVDGILIILWSFCIVSLIYSYIDYRKRKKFAKKQDEVKK